MLRKREKETRNKSTQRENANDEENTEVSAATRHTRDAAASHPLCVCRSRVTPHYLVCALQNGLQKESRVGLQKGSRSLRRWNWFFLPSIPFSFLSEILFFPFQLSEIEHYKVSRTNGSDDFCILSLSPHLFLIISILAVIPINALESVIQLSRKLSLSLQTLPNFVELCVWTSKNTTRSFADLNVSSVTFLHFISLLISARLLISSVFERLVLL